ncbi:hypothetical protein HanRHA438_Chr06g0258451 [Helianthus annuus]|nr:hypothetical protein HanIR_Chr06g0268231 [Helianthus annuus]KAJ0911002.1 hypothetical protein HanRHA438_Chr06g0258451 [Helianthus annuus]
MMVVKLNNILVVFFFMFYTTKFKHRLCEGGNTRFHFNCETTSIVSGGSQGVWFNYYKSENFH